MTIFIVRNGKVATQTNSQQYWGEKIGGELDSWNTISTDPNQFIRDSYGILSERNATLYQTEPLARACINKPLSYAIGAGIVFKSAINHEFLGWSRKKAKDWSKKFTVLLHLEKMAAGWYDNQAILFREASICGDSVLYLLREEGNELPIDLIPCGGHVIGWEMSDSYDLSAGWILGIKHDGYGRKTSFFQKSTQTSFDFKDKNGNINAIQFLFQELAGQARGYGLIHSAISLIKKMGRVWDATIARMVMESIMLGYYNVDTTDIGSQVRSAADAARGNSGAPSTRRDDTASTISGTNDLIPGNMMTLRNRESMTFNDIKTPSDNFGMANSLFLDLISMARGYPPEFISGKYNTSYTAHKGALNDSEKKFTQERTTFARTVERPVNQEYLKHFATTGQIDVPAGFWSDHKIRAALLQGSYIGPVPGHVNPLQEVNADVKAVEKSFTDYVTVARKFNRDWSEEIDDWAEQNERWSAASPEYQAEVMAAEESKRQAEEAKLQEESGEDPAARKDTRDEND